MMFHEVNTFLEQQSGQDYQNLKPPPLHALFQSLHLLLPG